MSSETIVIAVSFLAVIIASYSIWKAYEAKTPISGELIESTLVHSTTMAAELAEVGLTAARAAQQLFESGRITRDDRLKFALDYARQFFPDLNDDTLIAAIEAGVFVVNSVVSSLPEKKNLST